MLKIKNLTKHYKGSNKGVTNLSLNVEAGDIFAFIGHNGAGKTTTLKCVVGIHDFEEGEIHINGLSMKENPYACKKEFAYIPDNPDLYDYLTGIQYLNFIADVFEVPAADRQERIEKYANDFGIMCIFHGCTLPRGWERMFPNYVASEAILASENLHFSQGL